MNQYGDMEAHMPGDEGDPIVATELDAMLSALLIQAKKEPISKELRELAARLEAALQNARTAGNGLVEESR
ncbi:hypothetical protein [Paracoccus pacificus]|uniref:Uncharacterized protein n=1 Tax=Paracoccus pacificus TaxID=1463598 RepID=A0ABW4R635_9RHOB